MNGDHRYFFDTNAVIALLAGDPGLLQLWQSGQWAGISIISVIEFLVWPTLSAKDEAVFRHFLTRLSVIDLTRANDGLLNQIVAIRRRRNLKLPDAIILSCALSHQAVLVTRDEKLLSAAEWVLPGSGLRY